MYAAAAEALLQYAVTLAFYLYLRSSDEYAARPDLLRSHPIMSRLLAFKQHIATLEELQDSEDEGDLTDDDDLGLDDFDLEFEMLLRGDHSEIADEMRKLIAEDMMRNSQAASIENPSPLTEGEKSKKAEEKANEPPKKKRKTSSEASAKPLPVFDLEEPEFPVKPKVTARPSANVDDSFGEQTALDVADAADKASHKRSLRFHTAKIESASARRERARTSTGGDDDIPWKERRREREERQKKELEKSRGTGGADLDDEEPEPREATNKKRRRDEDDENESDGDGGDTAAERYYDLVKRTSKEKKKQKKAEYEEALAEAKFVVIYFLRCFLFIEASVQGRPHAGRAFRWSTRPYTRHPQEQGSHTTSIQERTQPACQEADAVREGQEEGRVSKSRVQGWPQCDRAVRRREVGYFQSHQESQAVSPVTSLASRGRLSVPCTASYFLSCAESITIHSSPRSNHRRAVIYIR